MLIKQSETFSRWLSNLNDKTALGLISDRLLRLRSGHVGKTRALGDGVSELKFAYGPGYRIYYGREGDHIVILLVGGDKGSQSKDIKLAKRLLTEWKDAIDG